jgi:predicted kinase
MDMAAATSPRTLFVLCGLPLSGKTTLAQTLLTEDTLLISRDQILETLYREPETLLRVKEAALQVHFPVSRLEETREANAFNDALTQAYVTRVTKRIQTSNKPIVIVDGTHLHPLSRSFVNAFPESRSIALVLTTPLAVCLERRKNTLLEGIRATITEPLLLKMHQAFIQPTHAEGFTEIRRF